MNGLITVPSTRTVPETVARLKEILAAKGIELFAIIDHSGAAETAGLTMPDTKLAIFGSPRAGTPLMLAAPSIAIDLPMRVLVQEDAAGRVSITYNDPEYLGARHGLTADAMQPLLGLRALVESL